MKIKEALAWRGLPQHDLVWLLSSILQKNRAELFLQADQEIEKKSLLRFRAAISLRKKGVPLQYIVRSAPFYGREFYVDERVLIPRPETEQLVEIALGLFAAERETSVLDVGTGSGAIALTIAIERSKWRVSGSDLSAPALRVAQKNDKRKLVKWGLGEDVPKHWRKKPWDLIVSNPPYLSFAKDKIEQQVKGWEPRMALEPVAKSRLIDIKDRASWVAERILRQSVEILPKYTLMELSPRVAMYLERRWRAHKQVEAIQRMPDLAGRKRFLLVAWKNG